VVPSRQRAEAVRLAHARQALRAGERVWASPDVLPFEAWLAREIEAVAESEHLPPLLTGNPEWLLWRQCTAGPAQALPPVARGALADGLRRASRLADEYAIALHRGGVEADLLCQVRRAVEERCAALGVASARALARALPFVGDERTVEFAGYSRETPFLRALIEARQQAGFPTRLSPPQPTSARAARVECTDRAEEFEHIAGWCRAHLQKNPDVRLLVVFPGAPAARERLRLFVEQALDGRGWLGGLGETGQAPVAIEGGDPLTRVPLVAHALTSLTLLTDGLDFETLSGWLCAPYWSAPDAGGRARVDLWLRHKAPLQFTAAELRERLGRDPYGRHQGARSAARELAVRLAAAAAELESRSGSPREWAVRFNDALALLGWPGAAQDSAAQQARQSFTELLSELGELTMASRSFGREQALQILRELAARTFFRPASGDPPVTITPYWEAPIIRYDGIWVSGLHASTWPPPVQPNPFFSVTAQRAANIPAATLAGRVAEARALMHAWRASAAELVFSTCRREEDLELAPSPLLNEWEVWPERVESVIWLPAALHRSGERESLLDDTAPAIAAGASLRAGTRLLELQSLCAFRACAQVRLMSEPLESAQPGIAAPERGQFMHRVLEALWRQLQSSRNLQLMPPQELTALIDRCVEATARERWGAGVHSRTQVRECLRTRALIAKLCDLERQRAPFRARDLEREMSVTLAGAHLDMRIDRVDELESGGLAILDYKTGARHSMVWYEEHLSHPQLLAYLAAHQEDVRALATVTIRAPEMGFHGIAASKNLLPKVAVAKGPDNAGGEDAWARSQAYWRERLEALVSDFLRGHAAVDPAKQACKNCDVIGLCRIIDRGLLEEDLEEVADE
jgi:ATP-dependent helicase/nuclease subunit B